MKLRTQFLIPLLGLAAPIVAPAQQTDSVSRTIKQFYQLDERGDAEIEVSFQYSASQWAQWKEEYGNRPDIVLRNLRYQMATAVLENFSLEKDDVQRKALGKIKARALARYRNAGEFVIDVPKEMNLVTGSGTEWIFSFTTAVNGEIVSQTLHTRLPARARDARFGPGGDFNALSYTLDSPSARPKRWLHIGEGFFALGTVFVVASAFTKRRRRRAIIDITPASPADSSQPPPLPPV